MGGTYRPVLRAGLFLLFAGAVAATGAAPAAAALAGRGNTTAMAGTRLSGAQRALRQQQAITVTTIDPFMFTDREPVVTFSGPDVFLDDLEVTAMTPPPAGAVDFATVTIDFINAGLSDAEYEAIFVTYALVLEAADGGDPSFISGVDGEGNPVRFGPGTANGIDVSMKAAGNADVPEPSAGLATLAGALTLVGLRRPERGGRSR